MQMESDKKAVQRLILQARGNAPEERKIAFETLLEQYEPLIGALCARFSEDPVAESMLEDLRQEAMVAFYNSILAYDTDQTEVEFGLYAKICISNALVSQIRRLKKQLSQSLTEPEQETIFVHESEDPSESILEQERVQALYLVIRNNLSSFEYRVWRYYMSGRTAREIGALLGKEERSISNAIYRIRRKLRAVLQ